MGSQVNMPSRRADDDLLSVIAKGLSIAKDVYSIRSEYDKNQKSEDLDAGIYTEPEMLKLRENYTIYNSPPEGTGLQDGTVQGGIRKRTGSPIYFSMKKPKGDFTKITGVDSSGVDKEYIIDQNKLGDPAKSGDAIVGEFDVPSANKYKNQTALRDEYRSDQVSKASIATSQYWNKIDGLRKIPKSSGPQDISLVYNYMHLLEPQSTVMQGEFETAANAGGVSTKWLNMRDNILRGQLLHKDVKSAFIKEADRIFRAQLKSQEYVDDKYTAIANYMKIDPQWVIDSNFKGFRTLLDGEESALKAFMQTNLPDHLKEKLPENPKKKVKEQIKRAPLKEKTALEALMNRSRNNKDTMRFFKLLLEDENIMEVGPNAGPLRRRN